MINVNTHVFNYIITVRYSKNIIIIQIIQLSINKSPVYRKEYALRIHYNICRYIYTENKNKVVEIRIQCVKTIFQPGGVGIYYLEFTYMFLV